jgi:DNA-directed RNA polymerase specialized sigma24 family protein
MSEPSLFDLVVRMRRGDSAAVQSFLEIYQDAIEREVRFALLDRRLRRVISESDVKQSVMMRFVVGLWSGKYEFDDPRQIAGLLKAIVRSRVADLARHWHAEKRDLRKNTPLSDPAVVAAVGREPTPSEIVANAELIEAIRGRLNDEEREILHLRQEGHSWHALAAQIGSGRTPEALRKRYERSLARVSRELGIDDSDDLTCPHA